MSYTRREFARLALAGLPAAAAFGRAESIFGAALEKPNSVIAGVQLGTITYSYRSMPDQTAPALLGYIVADGISAVELMGQPAEQFAGAPSSGRGRGPGPRGNEDGRSGRAGAGAGGRGGGRRGEPPTPEQLAAQREAREALKKWRTGASMDKYKELRKLFNDAGVNIYALKISPTEDMTDDEMDYVFNAAAATGATHVTLEVTDDMPFLKRVGGFAEKHKIYAAYHSHTQGGMNAFDAAFAASKANMANVDFGHYVAGGNKGGTALQFLQKFHDRIASFHMKDRTTPEHGEKNLPWGTGDTPLVELLQMVKKNRWTMPATIELEYDVPEGSDAVKEVAKCLEFCRRALAS
jgi:sugar phosphate isomerase/epimerase